jgi:hypothetical protein
MRGYRYQLAVSLSLIPTFLLHSICSYHSPFSLWSAFLQFFKLYRPHVLSVPDIINLACLTHNIFIQNTYETHFVPDVFLLFFAWQISFVFVRIKQSGKEV